MMGWDKFKGLAKSEGEGPSIGLRDSPMEAAALPGEVDAPRPLPIETRSGGIAKVPSAVRKYVDKARLRLRSPRVDAQYWLPDRIRKMTKGRSPAGFIDALLEQVMRDPRGEALITARALLNELGRDPQNAQILQDRLKPELIAQAIAAGRQQGGKE